ncbi:MAG: polyphosphate kinase, partial [Lachnospiraceae bacterium]|nr:polyphosphate kinase [Lachnospiraceae bacterium]
LAEAAENGKQVTVLVELKARFDETNNIIWARKLEQAGCHVIYGLKGLKVHSKITLVVRREEEGIRRYVHLGTGNYNDSTAKLYTDIGFFTCSEPYGEDATAVFNMLSGYSEPVAWNRLAVAPLWLKDRFLYLINREKENVLSGRDGRIIAKVNSLCDPDIIKALYDASIAGVHIDLIVRGICSLKAGLEGVSENITVRSIVGTYLEHARIFYFYNAGREELFCGSADWMPRNLERRVEIIFPVEKEELKQELLFILETQLNDNVKASVQTNGLYLKARRKVGQETVHAQNIFCRKAENEAKERENPFGNDRVFIPETGI